jgi:peptidoglycan/LPS O-acetylase OafA/YrhL
MMFIVAIRHLAPYSPYLSALNSWPGIDEFTYACLGLFCFLSGFLMADGREPIGSIGEIWAFYRKRLLRIYPPYLTALVALYLLQATGMLGIYSGGFGMTFGTLVASSLLVAIFLDCAPITLWFVNLIFLYYIATPLLIWRGCRRLHFWILFSVVAIILLAVSARTGYVDKRLFLFAPCYACGLLTGLYPRLRTYLFSPLGAAASLVCTTAILALSITAHLAPPIVFGALCAPILAPLAWKTANLLARLPRVRTFAQIGAYLSFAAYLLHRVTFTLAYEFYQPHSCAGAWIYWLGTVLPATLVVAYLLQKKYDHIVETSLPRNPSEYSK